jgi:hypothetical protein
MTEIAVRSADATLLALRATLTASGDRSNTVSNTFTVRWMGGGAPVIGDWTGAANAVKGFYNTTPSGSPQPVAFYLGMQCSSSTNAAAVDVYQIDPHTPAHYFGSPVFTLPFTLHASGNGGPYPQESAVCLSFRSAYVGDPEHEGATRPRASDRGRVYLGPLDAGAATSIVSPIGTQTTQLSSTFKNVLIGAAKALYAAFQAIGFAWTVWSRKEQIFKNVTSYAVNDDLDTQRRRSSGQPLQIWTPFPGSSEERF